MRASQFHITTTKETPSDAEIVSHRLMLRTGMIRRLASGLYTLMPLGLRTVRKIEAIVREEMNHEHAIELLMPAVQPAELWQESGRWEKYGPELLRLHDRHDREFCIGPTHEEVITDIARREIRSYRQLPITFYQIQTKFRDEIRPRFGVMRSREFIMKDAYSFAIDEAGMEDTFNAMHRAYSAVFDRIGLDYRAVDADSGSIGGARSTEFHVLADSGEDGLAVSTEGDFAANVEKAAVICQSERRAASQAMSRVDTPGVHTMEELYAAVKATPAQCLKTLLVKGADEATPVVALVLRGDHTLNEIKAEQHPLVGVPFEFASSEQIHQATGCEPGSIGPVGLDIPVLADADAVTASDFFIGANHNGQHLAGVNWGRDLPEPQQADLREAIAGDPNPAGNGTLRIVRGIEVGHIFQLGDTYSQKLGAGVPDENSRNMTLQMGCYGIGITRIAGAAIEQNHDERGIIWPEAIAPFQAAVAPINMEKSEAVRDAAEALYQQLLSAGMDVLFDDRPLRPGVMFADLDLIGIPHRFVVSDKRLAEGKLEYKHRRAAEPEIIARDAVVSVMQRAS